MAPSKEDEAAPFDATEDSDKSALLSLGDDESTADANLNKMSQALAIEGDEMIFCSACGKTGDDLKGCNGCRCIRYCSAACQKKHWRTHKAECKRIKAVLDGGERQPPVGQYALDMAAPLSEEAIASGLFDNPPPTPDCPICMVRLPVSSGTITYAPCCGKKICTACCYDNKKVFEKNNQKRADKMQAVLDYMPCPFCRAPRAKDNSDLIERAKKRAEKDDPIANWMLATYLKNEDCATLVDHRAKTLHFIRRAADLGDNDAQYTLARSHEEGEMGLKKDFNAARMLYEQSARGGHALARDTLGHFDSETTFNRTTRSSVMHWRIAAAAGFSYALEYLLWSYEGGYIRHQDFAPSLRAMDKALLEMKSESRDRYFELMRLSGKIKAGETVTSPVYNTPY